MSDPDSPADIQGSVTCRIKTQIKHNTFITSTQNILLFTVSQHTCIIAAQHNVFINRAYYLQQHKNAYQKTRATLWLISVFKFWSKKTGLFLVLFPFLFIILLYLYIAFLFQSKCYVCRIILNTQSQARFTCVIVLDTVKEINYRLINKLHHMWDNYAQNKNTSALLVIQVELNRSC